MSKTRVELRLTSNLWHQTSQSSIGIQGSTNVYWGASIDFDHPCRTYDSVEMDSAVETEEIICLPVASEQREHRVEGSFQGLLLAPAGAKSDEYRRIGTFFINREVLIHSKENSRLFSQQKLENGEWTDRPKITFTNRVTLRMGTIEERGSVITHRWALQTNIILSTHLAAHSARYWANHFGSASFARDVGIHVAMSPAQTQL